jgi:hypothetical protein
MSHMFKYKKRSKKIMMKNVERLAFNLPRETFERVKGFKARLQTLTSIFQILPLEQSE